MGAQGRFGNERLGEGGRAEQAGGEDEGKAHDNSKSEYGKANQRQSYSTAMLQRSARRARAIAATMAAGPPTRSVP